MFTSAALLDVHARAHRSLAALIAHARGFAPQDLEREHPGFGVPTLRLQIAHVIGAERYWLGVLEGRLDVEDVEERLATLDAIEEARIGVARATCAWLEAATEADLDTPRTMTTWGPRVQSLAPARVVFRVLTHVFHHQGQCAAMCRLLGRPVAGLDFAIA